MAKKRSAAKSRKQKSGATAVVKKVNAAVEAEDSNAVSDESPEPTPLLPIRRQPFAFWLSLSCLIGWLLFLAYVSFLVS